jgi:hypothetical protein
MSRDAVDAALARLAASREHLKHELLPPPDNTRHGGGGMPLPRPLQALWRWARRHFAGSPVMGMAAQAAQGWWRSHPWRSTSELVVQELHASATPLIRRHPLAATLGAAGLGAALMIWKPWRWGPVRRQLQPLPRHAGRWLLRQLAQPSVQAMLAGLLVSAGLGRAAHQASAAVGDPDAFAGREPPAPTPPWPDLPSDPATDPLSHPAADAPADTAAAASTAASPPAPAGPRQPAAID